MKCPNCSLENPEMAKFCGKCGTVIRTTQAGSNPSGKWYWAPILFGIVGGIIGYFAIRDRNKEMANNLIIVGIVSSALYWILTIQSR